MINPVFDGVRRELDSWSANGLSARLWLRDDDAIAATPMLRQLLERCRSHEISVLLAVIPMLADETLAAAMAHEPLAEVGVHGIRHRNHAPAPRKAEELALERGQDDISTELSAARDRLVRLFGQAAGRWYVPPWNRIAPDVAGWLPALGFETLSAFGPARLARDVGLIEANTHLDIIDWKGGRTGRPLGWVASELARQLKFAREDGGRPVGILTHHLVHDAAAWQALDAIIAVTRDHPSVQWIKPSSLRPEP
jgi:peptidoglycan/xylan/chitin deacetylase (PgdA/CDA1 family)